MTSLYRSHDHKYKKEMEVGLGKEGYNLPICNTRKDNTMGLKLKDIAH